MPTMGGTPYNKRTGLPLYCLPKRSGRTGRLHYYFQRKDYRVPLPDPDAPGFAEAYERALAAMPSAAHLAERAMFKALPIQQEDTVRYFASMQAGAKQRAKKAGRHYTLPYRWAAERYVEQRGVCALSGLTMRPSTGRFDFLSPSIDRIDSAQGYTPENCHLVAFGVNVAKGTMGVPDFIKLCRAVVAEARRTERDRNGNVSTRLKEAPSTTPKPQ